MSLETRGNDATGLAIQRSDGTVHVHKAPSPAWKFVSEKAYEDFCKEHLEDSICAIVHTRWATQGPPSNNGNNHPMFAGKCAVVHNGCINNDNSLFSSLKLERKAETDSDIIRAIVDAEGLERSTLKVLDKLNGSCAAAIISQEQPGKLMLLRSGSPLVLASTSDQLLWASTKEALHLASRLWAQRYGMWMKANATDLMFKTVGPDTALLFDENGMTWHQEFKSCAHYITPTYAGLNDVSRRVARHTRFRPAIETPTRTAWGAPIVDHRRIHGMVGVESESRGVVRRGGNMKLEDVVGTEASPRLRKCPNSTCKSWYDAIGITDELWKYKCNDCGTPLGEIPTA